MPTDYRRTPLPKAAQTPLGWLALWLLLLLMSPFAGFAIHGKVDEAGLMIGLGLAVLPLLALACLALRRWQALRRAPDHVREEWRSGRLIAADGAPPQTTPLRFAKGRSWMEFRAEGVLLSAYDVLGTQGTRQALETTWVIQQSGQWLLAWTQIAEWIVDSDTEGPDCYRLKLRPRGELRLRRFAPDGATESDLLDAVRAVGRVPIRLRCDLPCVKAGVT